VDAAAVDGRLHRVVDVVVFHHVAALVAEGEDAVAREVVEMVVGDIIARLHRHAERPGVEMHPAAVVADLAAVLDGVAGDLVEDRRHLGRRLARRVDLGVVHVAEARAGEQHPAAAGVFHRVAVEHVAPAVEVQPQGVTADVLETAVPYRTNRWCSRT
jgi:hypothetical protein